MRALVVTGNIKLAALKPLLEKQFGAGRLEACCGGAGYAGDNGRES